MFNTIENFRLVEGGKLDQLPATLVGKAGKVMAVNVGEDGYELSDTGSGDMTKVEYDSIIAANTAKETNIVHPLVEVAVPSDALFTDTNTIYDDTAIQAEVDANTAKIGITPTQASNITTNTAKISYTDSAAVALNTAKETNVDQTAAEVVVDAAAFSTNLSATDTDVQTALETINALSLGGGGGGAGDVVGPASATDENVAVFDSTTGKLIKDGGINKSAITANTAKTGITPAQASDITTNNSKISYTDSAAVSANTAKISFDSTSSNKLGTIEENADVTDTANVTAAGALMDSEVDADIKTLALPASTTISAFGASLVDDAAATNARTTLGLVIGTDVVAPNQNTTGKAADTDALNSATTTIDVASSAAPTTGQVLTATGASAATWQDAGGGGGVSGTFNVKYPHDITSGFEAWGKLIDSGSSYTVPASKVLYITQIYSLSGYLAEMTIDSNTAGDFGYNTSNDCFLTPANPILVSAGIVVGGASTNDGYCFGFLCDANVNISNVIISSNYTVPSGKILVIIHIYEDFDSTVYTINGVSTTLASVQLAKFGPDISMNVIHQPIFLSAGDDIAMTGGSVHYGYLIPDDFSI